ncbi:hypothetical protein LZ198_16890 [Myxococcus sp. K15C18031901]|uniref:hypothetical protein n=1 Tax=Myxococcus dinghuensis TaxID=2906761 RepID=UPI0020A766BA|nr:hypothetical protein [Myxococcus dinghuensis]MCP3100548.1 hypothetical protein [Myxococcus dinghuensis]
MRHPRLALLLCAASTALLFTPRSAEARPPGRKWESLGVIGNPGECYEIWVRKHWLWGWQLVHERVPCPGSVVIRSPLGVLMSDAPAFVAMSANGRFALSVFDPTTTVPIVLESSSSYVGPVLSYGSNTAALVNLTPDGEQTSSTRLGPAAYAPQVLVRASQNLPAVFNGPNQAALVTLSTDWSLVLEVHARVTVAPGDS